MLRVENSRPTSGHCMPEDQKKESQEQMQRHDSVETALAVACYSTCSVSMILLNKLVVDTYKINYPISLLFLQNFSAYVLVATAKHFGLVSYPDFDRRVAKKWIPLTLLFVLMLYTSIKSLRTMSVAVQTIIKNLAIVVTAIGDWRLFGKQLSVPIFGVFFLMVCSSWLGSANDPWVTPWGLFWTFLNVFATVSYVLFMKLLVQQVSNEIGKYGPVYYNNVLSLPFLAPAALVTMPDFIVTVQNASVGGWICLSLMLLLGAMITFTSFWCMRQTSPTTYSVVGALNKVPLSLLGILIFRHKPTMLSAVGICGNLLAGVFYAYLNRLKPKTEGSDDASIKTPVGGTLVSGCPDDSKTSRTV